MTSNKADADRLEVEHVAPVDQSNNSDQEEKQQYADELDNDPIYTREEQRKIIHRLDWRLISIAGIIYMNSLMDRSNLPNAAIAGMNDDLEMDVGDRYVRIRPEEMLRPNL